jgi:arylsulfatase A-like enzyme
MSLHRFALLILLFAMAPSLAFAQQAARKPNIVFILADDLGINDLGCYGRKDQNTPNLDKLARAGMRFTNAYAAQSVCSPTRAAIMTGKTPARLHLTTFLTGRADAPSQLLLHPRINLQLPKGERTLAEYLRAAGYRTLAVGKWHLGGMGSMPTDKGFDDYFAPKALTTPSATEGGKGEYALTSRAEKFIEDNKDHPFFLYLAHNNPHVPLAAKKELIEKNKNSFNPIYAAMIETLDDCVGRVVAKLDSLGLAENTIIIFTSDNGGLHVLETPNTPATYNRPYRAGKGFIYEGGLRIPMIVRWTGKVKAGTTVDTPVISTDWTPTLLAAAGVNATEKFDGINLAPLLLQNKAPPPRALYWHQPHYMNQGGRPAGAVREGSWRLVEHYENGACELYNLDEDPGEMKDLAAAEPARVAGLRGKLEAWRRAVGAQENTANPEYNGKVAKQLYVDLDTSRLPFADKAAKMALTMESWRTLMNDVLPGKKKNGASKYAGAGAIILHARTAKILGDKLRYEDAPNKDTLGFWTKADDRAEWTFDLPHAGVFAVELLQGCGKGSGGAALEVTVSGQTLQTKVEETGHFQRFVPRVIGTVKLDFPGRYTLSVRATSKPGPAVMDLRRVILRDAP